MKMEIAENEENNSTTPVTPSPVSTTVVVYPICICEHISAETGFKKEVYLQFLKRI